MRCALTLARLRAGNNMAASIAMIAMTTNSSINVKPLLDIFIRFIFKNFPAAPLRAAGTDLTYLIEYTAGKTVAGLRLNQ